MDKLFDIIHEDAELLVINKPADLVCHPTKGDVFSSLVSRVRLHLGPDVTPRLVNRLDRETGGVTVVAKTPEAARELGRLWETRAVEKEYLAIVHGHLPGERGSIDAPLGKDEQSRVVIKDCVRPDGASAQTEYVVVRRFDTPVIAPASPVDEPLNIQHSTFNTEHPLIALPGELDVERSKLNVGCSARPFTFLRLIPKTGRKHQIRIHLAHLGHPIVGDKLYGGEEDAYLALVERRLTEAQRQTLLLPNHALHAAAVRFVWHEARVEFRCEPEQWFVDFLPPAP